MTRHEAAIRFWEAVNERFPHPDVAHRIASLKAGRGEWFRDAGLALIAITENSRSERGTIQIKRYEAGKQVVAEIARELDLNLQW